MELLNALLNDSVESQIVSIPCKVAVQGEKLSEPYQTAYWKIVLTTYENGGLTEDHAAAKLASAGIQIGATTIRRHRSGLCRCPRKG